MTKIINWITQAALTISFGIEQLAVALVSMIPMIELKGGIPIGVKLGLSLGESFLYAFIGSSIVAVPCYFIMKLSFKWKPFQRLETLIKKKASKLFQKTQKLENQGAGKKKQTFYKTLGVFLFVAIPIPLTGVYTGVLVAVLLGMEFHWTLLSTVLGNAVAGGVILLLTAWLGSYIDLFLFILFIVVIILFALFIWKLARQKNTSNQQNSLDSNS